MTIFDPILNYPPVSRVRRNHALEHATLQILARKNPYHSAAGYSDTRGFWVLGDVSTDDLTDSVNEALNRLRAGERGLAIHPNCGTNFVTAGIVGGGLAWLATLGERAGWRSKLERLPLLISLLTIATILSQPLGMRIQALVTTDASIRDLRVTEIIRLTRRDAPMHRVKTVN
jgi:hypothetical protein